MPQTHKVENTSPAAVAAVFGTSGAIGGAIANRLDDSGRFETVFRFSRRTDPAVDITREESVAAAADLVAGTGKALRLVVDATGFLHGPDAMPEKSWRDLDPERMARAFAVNAIGPALILKHFLPLLPYAGRSVFATLSAKVGSIADNRLGGWYSYRASKAALNQIVRTAAVELGRRRPDAICVALHPGTVDSPLSAPFAKDGLTVRPPAGAAARLLDVIDGLTPADSGGFYDHSGKPLPW